MGLPRDDLFAELQAQSNLEVIGGSKCMGDA